MSCSLALGISTLRVSHIESLTLVSWVSYAPLIDYDMVFITANAHGP